MSAGSNELAEHRPIGEDDGLGDTPVEVLRLQASIMSRLHPDHRTREALRMSSALLRMRQATLLVECGGDRDRMLERFVELHHGPTLAREFAARRRHQR